MIQFYFQLQLQFAKRRFEQAGFNFLLAIFLLLTAGVAISILLYKKTNYAGAFLTFQALALCVSMASQQRTEFLQTTFKDQLYKQIRLLENCILVSPFVLILLFNQDWIYAGICLLLGPILSLKSFTKRSGIVLPTPFGKHPFEFILGTRKFWWTLPIVLTFIFIGWKFNNFNLSAVAFALYTVIILHFYNTAENEIYVWNEARTPAQFIGRKITNLLRNSTIYTCIPLLLLIILFPNMWYYSILLFLIIQPYLMTNLVMKYTRYPQQITFIDGFILAFCVLCPPIIVLVFIYFYKAAKKSLSFYLR